MAGPAGVPLATRGGVEAGCLSHRPSRASPSTTWSWWAAGSLDRAAALFDRHADLGLLAGRVVVEPQGRDDPFCALLAASPLEGAGPGVPILGFMACAAVVRRDAFLEALFSSGSDLLILPVQDVFGWPDRINQPATVGTQNWTWKLPWPSDRLLTEPEADQVAVRLRTWATRHGR